MRKHVCVQVVLVLALLILTSCGKYQKENNQETAQNIYGHSKMAVSENGYYYIIDNILYFYNVSGDINIPMCSRVNCAHKDDTCDAYVSDIVTDNGGSFECNCMGEKVMFYDNHLYCIEVTRDREYNLYQYNEAFNNRKLITRLASVKDNNMMVSDAQACLISEGYLYYYMSYLDSQYAANGYTAPFYACRIKLDGSTATEVLGEFRFPGDYALKPSDSNGLAIYQSDGNIYFYAGGTARMYCSDDIVQYYVAKYNPTTSQYKQIWTYVSNETKDTFGDGTGYVNYMSGGDCVKMDSKGNFYIMTSKEKGVACNMIVRVNFEENSHDVIYITQMEKLYSLQSDGSHLIFFESTASRSSESYLKAIDTAGSLISQFKLEYAPEYESYVKDYFTMFPDAEATSITAEFITVYGIDTRYIVFGSNGDNGFFKGLTAADMFKVSEKHNSSSTTHGVGVLNTADYLDTKDVSIKQIYQYEQ